MTSLTVLSAVEKSQLERLCRNRLNWSDGGRWIGKGEEPNCSLQKQIERKSEINFSFPTTQAADKWNAEMEKSIRYTGYALSALVTFAPIAFTSITGITVSMTAATGAIINIGLNVAQGELLASTPYPKVARGSSAKLTMSYKTIWGPFQSQKKLVQTVKLEVVDHLGKKTYSSTNRSQYRMSDIPDNMQYVLSAPNPAPITITYN